MAVASLAQSLPAIVQNHLNPVPPRGRYETVPKGFLGREFYKFLGAVQLAVVLSFKFIVFLHCCYCFSERVSRGGNHRVGDLVLG